MLEKSGMTSATNELPRSATEIYDLLFADETIHRFIGRYTLADKSKVPALICMWPNESLPPQSKTQGVELVVLRGPSGAGTAGLGFTEEMNISKTFRLYAVQWEPEVPGDYCLDEIVQRVAQLLPNSTWDETSVASGTDGLGQVAIRWRNPVLGACLI